jgi:thioredoxin reductase (NADPH)
VAVGGRPSPLQCEGAELAITSDDLFMKSEAPGKTCVVGAGYVALECAGFIQGLRQAEVTVLVRSILLRGFDRDITATVHSALLHHGVNIREGVMPASISRQDNGSCPLPLLSDSPPPPPPFSRCAGRLLVKMTDGSEDEFDTVLAAVGPEQPSSRPPMPPSC